MIKWIELVTENESRINVTKAGLSEEAAQGKLSKLKELYVNENQLTFIGKGALPKGLTHLHLSKNRLKRLDEDFFAGFRQLCDVNLAENELDMIVTEETFASCRHRSIDIDLSQNESIRFTAGTFGAMKNLLRGIEYDFSENFVNLSHCRRLRIRKLTPQVLQALKKINFYELKVFCLSNCSIKSLKRDPDWKNKNKQETSDETGHFNLSWLFRMWNLEKLDLSKNLIETLDDPELFANSTRIDEINLSGNQLSRIHRDIFKCLRRLERIDLSGNNLSSIDMGLFRHQRSLTHLNISSNNISFLNFARLFRICPELKSLNIADNQLDDRSTAEPIDAKTSYFLGELVMANNHFETMDFVRDMTSLRHLDFRGNRIESVMSNGGENLLGRLEWLTHLDLSGNQINWLTDEMFTHIRDRLFHLDLSENPLHVLQLDSVLSELI